MDESHTFVDDVGPRAGDTGHGSRRRPGGKVDGQRARCVRREGGQDMGPDGTRIDGPIYTPSANGIPLKTFGIACLVFPRAPEPFAGVVDETR
jgi:hypothetical protein